jgi:hypothetical protein
MNNSTRIITLDGRKIAESFHDYFAEEFGFPDFYGRNMDAWIDCITYLDDPAARMCSHIFIQPGEQIIFHINHIKFLKTTNPKAYDDLIECTAFVNYRRIDGGGTPLIYLSFTDTQHD